MASKALIIGARPSPFEGPWIPVSEADEWEVVGERHEAIVVEVSNGPPHDEPIEVNGNTFSAPYARVRILDKLQVESVSVEIRRVR